MAKIIHAFVICLFIFSGLNANNIVAQEIKMNILKSKPVYQLSVKAFGTKYFVQLNGVIIHQELFSGGQLSTALPVNHWMRSGMNTIGIYVFPENPGDEININASVTITLMVSDKDNPNIQYSVANISFSGKHLSGNKAVVASSPSGRFDSERDFSASTSGDVEIHDITKKNISTYEGELLFSRKIDIPSSLPVWAFFKSNDVPDYKPMSDADYYKHMDVLLVEYMKVQKALESGNVEAVMPLFAERNKELDAAFYLEPGTMEKKISAALLGATDKNEYELVILTREYVDFTVEDNQKLASLTRVGDKPAITLNFKKGSGAERYSLIFRLKDGKWILTR